MSNLFLKSPLARQIVFSFAVLFAILIQQSPAYTKQLIVVAYGDSLTAGYGLPKSAAFPYQLEQKLKARGHSVKIINAGVTGDTTASDLARLNYSLPKQADAVILELGANDALRGIDPRVTAKNLEMIVAQIKKRGIPILLAGMLAPPHMGRAYTTRFKSVFYDIARRHGVLFYPFFLKGVALRPSLNQFDRMHPNAAGINVIVNGILPTAERLVVKASKQTRRN